MAKNQTYRDALCPCQTCQQRRAQTLLQAVSLFKAKHGDIRYSFVRLADEVQALADAERAGGYYLVHRVATGSHFIHIGEFSSKSASTKPVPAMTQFAVVVAGWQRSGAGWEIGTGWFKSLVEQGGE